MTQQELVQRVSWTVEPAPPEARVAGVLTGLLGAVAAVASLGSTTGAALRPTWELPADPDEYVGLGPVRVRGQAPWLPGGTGGRYRLRATQRTAWVDRAAARRPPVEVPLGELSVARARHHGVGRGARRPEARWTLTLTGAGTVEVQGAWLALAWVGQLAGWPEPAAA